MLIPIKEQVPAEALGNYLTAFPTGSIIVQTIEGVLTQMRVDSVSVDNAAITQGRATVTLFCSTLFG